MAWADPRVYDAVRLKWDSLPTPNDKKKGGKGGKKSATKRPNSVPPKDGAAAKVDNDDGEDAHDDHDAEGHDDDDDE